MRCEEACHWFKLDLEAHVQIKLAQVQEIEAHENNLVQDCGIHAYFNKMVPQVILNFK